MYILDTLLDGLASQSLNLAITERPEIPTPQQVVESIEVEGRHGSLTRLGAFKDISFPIEYNILEYENIKPLLRQIRGYFFGKKTLQFTDDHVFYKIKSLQISETNNEIEEYGLFTVTFVCDPFQYELNNSLTIMQPTTLFNPGTIESEPILTVYGNGDLIITINGVPIMLEDVVDYVVVDSELMNSYKGDVSKNNLMTGDFPLFIPGKNTISWEGSVSKIVIEPGWRYI
ncbi:phage tail domain-containing protein [Neobacillus niacini]|uniref:phage tail domain-containing protein n=1 Tax=Neobacillus niacini TaxID=86668 RepID=UPI002FFD8CFC